MNTETVAESGRTLGRTHEKTLQRLCIAYRKRVRQNVVLKAFFVEISTFRVVYINDQSARFVLSDLDFQKAPQVQCSTHEVKFKFGKPSKPAHPIVPSHECPIYVSVIFEGARK